jgi:hypothetical protein
MHLVDLVARFANWQEAFASGVSFLFSSPLCKIKDKGRDDILVSWSKARYLFQAKRGESLNKAGTNVSNKYRVAPGKGEQIKQLLLKNKMYRDARFGTLSSNLQTVPPCLPLNILRHWYPPQLGPNIFGLSDEVKQIRICCLVRNASRLQTSCRVLKRLGTTNRFPKSFKAGKV